MCRWEEGCRGFARPPINVPTTGQRGVGSTEAEPFGKDEGIDLSVEARWEHICICTASG